jgi:hypothetical protein
MKIPGVLAVALVAEATMFLHVLASGISALDQWWAPVLVALLGALLKWLDVQRPTGPTVTINGVPRTIKNDSKLRRFFLG